MKRITMILTGIGFSISVLNAQVAPPQAFSFQATILNAKSKPVDNKLISLKISILQDNSNGFPVYSEDFHPTTDQNALVSVQIGEGNVLTGNFASIDWSAFRYFLKVEVDFKGGNAYQLLSVTQLLSVPYALYAGSAGSAGDAVSITGDQTITGNKSFTKDVSVNGLKANKANQTLNIDGKVGISKTDAAYNLDVSGDINFTGTLYNNGSPLGVASSAHSIGESYGGGIVFFVYDNGQHGLIAAPVDDPYSVGTMWYAGTYVKTMAIAGGIGAGKLNTFIIYAVQGEGNTVKYAARAAIQGLIGVVGINYGDWYLPSTTELGLLYDQKAVVGGFVSDKYWSSNENNASFATSQDFNDGTFHIEDKSTINGVRFIRSF